MATHRTYSDNEKAAALAALAANGGNLTRTAKELGIPKPTLRNWSRGQVHPEVTKDEPQKKADLADICEDVAYRLAGVMPDKIPEATLQQIATSFGIIVDKMRLLREQPTSITGNQLTDAERAARLVALADRARARRMAAPPGLNGNAPLESSAGSPDNGLPQ